MELTDPLFLKIWRVKEKAWMTRHIDHDVLERQFVNRSSTGLASTSQFPLHLLLDAWWTYTAKTSVTSINDIGCSYKLGILEHVNFLYVFSQE